jgi:hypothetical protein
MAVKTYSLSQGDPQLTAHLKLSEFRTPGIDAVLLDDDIAPAIEAIRDGITKRYGIEVAATVINSGYRTPGAGGYDRKVGGSGSGPHTTGKAADFYFRDKNGKAVNSIYGLTVAQLLGYKGIERIMDGVSIHIDVNYRANYWWAYQYRAASGAYAYGTVNDFFTSSWAKNVGITPPETCGVIAGTNTSPARPLLRYGSSGNGVKELQTLLNTAQTAGLVVDGSFGALTLKKVTEFQKSRSLAADGVVGSNTWKELCKYEEGTA